MDAAVLRSTRPLALLLARERQVLERLGWQLRVAQVLVGTGRLGWAGPALREADALADRLGALELVRAVELAGVGPALGLGDEPTLAELVARWPAPGRPVLRRQAHQLHRLVATVTGQARALAADLAEDPPDEPALAAVVRRGGRVVAGRVPPPSLAEFVPAAAAARRG